MPPPSGALPAPGGGAAPGPEHPPPADTSGFAIAALVLAIVWLGGLGSLLGLVFGAKAKQDIRRSAGDLGGDGMATAGMVLGILGVMGAATVWIGLIAGVHEFQKSVNRLATPETLAMGQTGRLSGIDSITGISSVTVYSYTQPVTSQDVTLKPEAGKEFGAADVQVCAGSFGSQDGPDLHDFSLVFAGGSQLSPTPGAVRAPWLGDVRTIAADLCVTGYVPFETALGARPASVQYQALSPYRWTIPPSG
jgi:Domain of unknown function (DUF4190)